MRRTSQLLLALALASAACGDGDPAGPGGGSEFDPVAVNQALSGLYDGVEDDSDALVGLDLASEALGGAGSAAVVIAGGDLARPRLAPDVPAARAFAAAASATVPIFPSNLLGRTFVWNVETDAYEVDEALAGAPANGVRFILYAIEPITRRPVEPLVEVGHLDLSDESGAESTRLVIEAVVSGVTLVDYFIDGSYTATAGGFTVTAAGVGYVSDGTHRVDFDLQQSASFAEGSSVATFTLDHALAVESEGVSVTLTGTVVLDFESGEGVVSAEFAFTIEAGGDTVVLTAEATATSLAGSIVHNGALAVQIGGTPDDPTFTRAGGGDLTAAEIEALRDLVELVADLFDFADDLFHPFAEVVA